MRCTSKDRKFNNLTVGKDYPDAKSVDDTFIELTNDSGVLARYNKKYFEENTTPPAPVFMRRTIIELSNLLSRIQMQFDEGIIRYRFNSISRDFELRDAPISCGIHLGDGMNDLRNFVHNVISGFETGREMLSATITPSILYNELFKRILEEADTLKSVLIVSTNNPDDIIFEGFSASSGVTKCPNIINQNSSNLIAVWVIDTEQYLS